MKNEISVITTSMNYGRYLEDNIKSVLGQKASFPFKIHHIIMDGGSTDNTVQILEKYEGQVNYYVTKGEGQTPALNHAMRVIESKFPDTNCIGWLNADDYYNPIWLQASLSVLRREPKDVALTCGRINQIGLPPELIEKWEAMKRWQDRSKLIPYVQVKRMVKGNAIIQPTVLIRMSAFKELKRRYGFYFNEEFNFTQDLELWHRFLANDFRIRRISARVTTLRRHPKRMSRMYRRQQIREGNKCREWLRLKTASKKNLRVAFLWHVQSGHTSGFWENKIDSMQNAIARLSEDYQVRVFVSTNAHRQRQSINGQDITFYKHNCFGDLLDPLRSFKPNMIFMNQITATLWKEVIHAFPSTWKSVIDYGHQTLQISFHQRLNKIIVQQPYQKQIVLANNDVKPEKVEVNPFCIRTDLFRPMPTGKLYTGVMLADFRKGIKRQHLLIRAWKKIPGRLLLIGRFERSIPTNYHEECKKLAVELGVLDRISFMNGCSNEKLPYILNMAKIAYLTSYREGGSRALLEKMACGLPALVTRDCQGSINLIKLGIDGLVAKPNPDDIAEKTKTLLAKYREMGAAASNRIRKTYPYDQMFTFYRNLIEEVRTGG